MFFILLVYLIFKCFKNGIMVDVFIDYLLYCNNNVFGVWIYKIFMGVKVLFFRIKIVLFWWLLEFVIKRKGEWSFMIFFFRRLNVLSI